MKCREFESLIDCYLDGTISEDKREIFEEHYFLCDNCFSSLKTNEILFNKKVQITTGRKRSFSFIFKPSLILASLIFIVFSSLFFVDLNNTNKKLLKVSAFSPPLYIKGENRGSNSSSEFHKAMDHYRKGEYESAYGIITSMKEGGPQIWFFRGILALLNGENREALNNFDRIVLAMDPSYYDEAVFYRGVSYLRMNRKDEALREFRTLEKMFSPLSEKASEKLKMLSEL